MMASFDSSNQPDKHQHDRYQIKKVGKYWLMKVNGKPLRVKFLDHAKEVFIEDTFLIADDKLFEIQENESGEIAFQKVEDFVHEPKESEHTSNDLQTDQNGDILYEGGSAEIDSAIKIESNVSNSNEEKSYEVGNTEIDRTIEMISDVLNQECEEEGCVICMDTISDPKTLKCGHSFCSDCIEAQFEFNQACPTCGQVCGIITGDQPDGDMSNTVDRHSHCSGYEGCGKIVITYNFPSGRQGPNHPRPRAFYKGITRVAYLPNNTEGRKILAMLKIAFERKLVFTIGNSSTTGQEGVITWNDIHHKTNPRPHQQFGYPDPGYLERVKDELAVKGVTEEDIQVN